MSSEKEPTYSMQDLIDDELYLQAAAQAVLGASSSDRCSYAQGYLYRQGVFSCLTCQKSGNCPVGVCLACSLNCHAGHDIVELWTKRNFRCDCGTPKVKSQCSFVDKPIRDIPALPYMSRLEAANYKSSQRADNARNVYGHNFNGRYCSCDRPFPDADLPDDCRDLLQCVLCEDWFHDDHLGCEPPAENRYDEMICMLCVRRHSFLSSYRHLSVGSKVVTFKLPEDGDDVEEECPVDAHSSLGVKENNAAPMFLREWWRGRLCRCNRCLATYELEGVTYLLNKDDPLSVYVNRGLPPEVVVNNNGPLDAALESELAAGYADIRARLKRRLEIVCDEGDRIVTQDDANEAFQEVVEERKKRRTQ